ncbi:unnamed protein product [Diabrotica balteata]|uniref:Elongation of very long chain fatty acids protein n=1 Tax=Diabrotica balteata TaxID=107213 RepID=A0A9P0GT02_DIABA|nr:unnamed protein product [Diabrotica balteata]
MALILKRTLLGYRWLFDEIGDSRPLEQNLFLMSSPLQPLAVILTYLYFIYRLGPRLMQNRQPFELKGILIAYNLTQIVVNAFIVYVAFKEVWFNINWHCEKIGYGRDPHSIYILKMYHLFLMTKLADLLETVFFVLRKRQRQITFLHVYHHFGMFLIIWITVRFVAGGYNTWVGLINSAVHTIMYTYYFLSSLDEKWKQNVTFKKFITQIQLVQFSFFIFLFGRQLFVECGYPKLLSIFFVPQNFFMLVLFSDFYRRAYLKKPVASEKHG